MANSVSVASRSRSWRNETISNSDRRLSKTLRDRSNYDLVVGTSSEEFRGFFRAASIGLGCAEQLMDGLSRSCGALNFEGFSITQS